MRDIVELFDEMSRNGVKSVTVDKDAWRRICWKLYETRGDVSLSKLDFARSHIAEMTVMGIKVEMED